VTVALGFRRPFKMGPALRVSPVPVAGLTLSAILHGVLIIAAVIAIQSLKDSRPEVYVVNLVPAIPAIGRPEGRATTPAPVPPAPAPPAPPAPTPPAPRVETPPAPKAPPAELPSRDVPKDLPARATRESSGLPDRTLPPRSAAPAPRPAPAREKELPAVASTATPQAAREPERSTAATAAPTPAPSAPPVPAGLPTGSPHGKGKLTVDVNFPHAWYIKIIKEKIAERWDPRALPGQQPRVAFEIDPNGRVNLARVRVTESSGNRAYDQIAVRAVAEASPFPPLPDDFKDKVVTINIQFRFEGEQG
jgi:TonB family protein